MALFIATIGTYIVNTKLSREHFTVGVLVFPTESVVIESVKKLICMTIFRRRMEPST